MDQIIHERKTKIIMSLADKEDKKIILNIQGVAKVGMLIIIPIY